MKGMAKTWVEKTLLDEMDHLYHVALRLTRDPAVADDVVQETYARALRARSSLRDAARARAWLFSILRNVFLNHAKRERRFRLVDVEQADEAVQTTFFETEQRLLAVESAAALERALMEVPPEFRMAVMLCDVEDFSYAEIAEMMDCPIGTVRSRIARGRALLASKLQNSALTSASQAGRRGGLGMG